MLLSGHTCFLEDNESDKTERVKPVRDNCGEDPTKLWGCFSRDISQSSSSIPNKKQVFTPTKQRTGRICVV